jgi:N-acetylglucosaminyldiphosphoundecaprenol N-acetyl-beta-D-mannosaminyltransferase
MGSPREINVLGCRMHALTMKESLSEILSRVARGEFTQHVVVNVAKLVNSREDPKLKESIEACDLINVDGMGVVWGGRFLGHDIPERVAGIDLFFALLRACEERGYPVYFLGAKQEILEEAVLRLRRQYPGLRVAGSHHGYFWDDEAAVVEDIRNSGAFLLFVAITSPKKEVFINKWRDKLGIRFAMGVGGTFDVVAGFAERAPLWMQKAGLEWFYRLLQEPGRMWKRYLSTNAKFLWLVAREKFRGSGAAR